MNNFIFLLLLPCSVLITVDYSMQVMQLYKNITSLITTRSDNDSVFQYGELNVNSHNKRKRKRKRRYLIFDKGALVTFQGNVAKGIISGVPKGVNEIQEYTLSYELPTSIEIFRLRNVIHVKTTTKKKKLPAPPLPPMISWQPYETPIHNYWPSNAYKRNWQNNFLRLKPTVKSVVKNMWCPKENVYKAFYKWNYVKMKHWCEIPAVQLRMQKSSSFQRRSIGSPEDLNGNLNAAESIFFDLIGMWAKLHGYNSRHCIMRTLCESQFVLLPRGHFLFHDLVRIMIQYSLPAVQRHDAYKKSISRVSLNECAHLYGPHCRVSILQHFTKTAMHGRRFM